MNVYMYMYIYIHIYWTNVVGNICVYCDTARHTARL